jgi:phage/plasmid-like protein (TIGR03299 family)
MEAGREQNIMSKETQGWLENNILIGFTEKRGNAWWYRGVDRADGTPNHYVGAVPIADVETKLFDWEPIELPVYTGVPVVNSDGVGTAMVLDPSRKAIAPSDDPSHNFGIFSSSYQPHGPREWLVSNVADLIGAENELQISSAGQLKGRAVPWVEISVPETFHTAEGIDFRANLVATTSFDGSIATTYKRTTTLTVCDNTLRAALAENGETYKRRHTAKSNSKSEQDKAREALGLIYASAEDITAELSRLCEWTISDVQFKEVLRLAVPIGDSKRGATVGERKRDEVEALYRNDARVAPWGGTAFGVVQAFNTWNHHVRATHTGTDRAERNMLNTLRGDYDKWDGEILALLEQAYATV